MQTFAPPNGPTSFSKKCAALTHRGRQPQIVASVRFWSAAPRTSARRPWEPYAVLAWYLRNGIFCSLVSGFTRRRGGRSLPVAFRWPTCGRRPVRSSSADSILLTWASSTRRMTNQFSVFVRKEIQCRSMDTLWLARSRSERRSGVSARPNSPQNEVGDAGRRLLESKQQLGMCRQADAFDLPGKARCSGRSLHMLPFGRARESERSRQRFPAFRRRRSIPAPFILGIRAPVK